MRSILLSGTNRPRSISKPELFKTTGSWNFSSQIRLPQLSGGGIESEIRSVNFKPFSLKDYLR
jgi:hypothetical protein